MYAPLIKPTKTQPPHKQNTRMIWTSGYPTRHLHPMDSMSNFMGFIPIPGPIYKTIIAGTNTIKQRSQLWGLGFIHLHLYITLFKVRLHRCNFRLQSSPSLRYYFFPMFLSLSKIKQVSQKLVDSHILCSLLILTVFFLSLAVSLWR